MGEFELIEAVRRRLPQAGSRVVLGSGDDAAIAVPGGATATSVDALVDGVHFRREWSSLAQVGHKALAVALSDLAAMGAEPGEAYVVLGVPRDLDEDGCLELLDGMAALAARTGTTLAGGDVTRAPVLTLAMTVVGHAAHAEDFVTRAGARPGDALVLSGELGGAAAGLRLLEAGGDRSSALSGRQLQPEPRLAEGRMLAKGGATAMIDLSDGLGGDARHLAAASVVALRIDAAALPLASGVSDLEMAVSGGEDYELLAAIPLDRLDEATKAVEAAGTRLTPVGEVLAGEGVEIRLPGGGTLPATGFDQLS
jgi:thiamine-monophosphate kinase